MSALTDVRANLLATLSGQLPNVQISPSPPAENTNLRESVWVERADVELEWGCLGPPSITNPFDTRITLDVMAHAYREAGNQATAAAAAWDQVDAVFVALLAAAHANQTLDGACSWWRPETWAVEQLPREKGWLVTGRARLVAVKTPHT